VGLPGTDCSVMRLLPFGGVTTTAFGSSLV
jgi:hypothetical protein